MRCPHFVPIVQCQSLTFPLSATPCSRSFLTPLPPHTQTDKLHNECSEVRRQLQHQEQETERVKQEGFIETERVRTCIYVYALVYAHTHLRILYIHIECDHVVTVTAPYVQYVHTYIGGA